MKDARAQVLPTVGGEIHDWGYILGTHGLLEKDQQAGTLVWTAGLLIMTAAVVFGFRAVQNRK
jgi:hypothetical protein